VSDSELSSAPEDSSSGREETKSRKRKRRQDALPVATVVKSESKEMSMSAIATSEKANGTAKKTRRIPMKKTNTKRTGTHELQYDNEHTLRVVARTLLPAVTAVYSRDDLIVLPCV
jgi:HD-GYP domain-containing protein (c-di-GMP phosphodiesterase class II)